MIKQAAIRVFTDLLTDEEYQRLAADVVQNTFHYYQVKSGKVNLHSQEEALRIAMSTCIRKDHESQSLVAAFVTGLYLQHPVERAAQVGGSLLLRFGKSWFPHINDREKKFALEVDDDLESYLLQEIEMSTNRD